MFYQGSYFKFEFRGHISKVSFLEKLTEMAQRSPDGQKTSCCGLSIPVVVPVVDSIDRADFFLWLVNIILFISVTKTRPKFHFQKSPIKSGLLGK